MTTNTQTFNKQRIARPNAHIFRAAFKAGVGGGLAISALLVVYQISFAFLQIFLIPPALFIVWVVTGIAGTMLAGNMVKTNRDGAKVGVITGLIAGIVTGITSMVIAAFGTTFVRYGQGFLAQFSDTQLISFAASGVTEQLIIISGSVLSAMFVCGVGGMFVSALLGGFGGWLYPTFNK